MKIVYNIFIPFKGYSAMMFFGVIFARKESYPLSKYTLNHEKIHRAQAKDCGGYISFYIRYLGQWIRYGYRNAPFEREAYGNALNLQYLDSRQTKAWREYQK